MEQKGNFSKTEIFCLILTAAFVVWCGTLFLQQKFGTAQGGYAVTTWEKTDVTQTLPQKIDINAAGAQDLQRLPGIGPVLAQRIVDWREENGDFVIVEDLLAVEGIGAAKLDEIRDLITIQEES